MINSTTIFLKLMKQREFKIKKHGEEKFCEETSGMSKEKEWYDEAIIPIDEKIVKVANAIIAKFSIPCKEVKKIEDVYENKWLMNLVTNHKKYNIEDSFTTNL
ncbi:MAG: hypothetical protein IKY10_01830 [Clostridia bacterium]|nr:hypothetical protein [Clostridia bacterium]